MPASLDVNSIVLSRISHLELTNRIGDIEKGLFITSGSYGEIYKCRCAIEGTEEAEVAAKRLRICVNSSDIIQASLFYSIQKYRG